MKKLIVYPVLFISIIPTIFAQSITGHEPKDFDDPEAWALKYFASVSLFSGYGTQQSREQGWFDFGIEVVSIPTLGKSYRTVGFAGTKEENLNNAPVLIRPVASIYLDENFSLSFSYVPPVELWDVKAHVFSSSANWKILENNSWTIGSRVYWQLGETVGHFTCSEEFVAPGTFCQHLSNDRAILNYIGAEINISKRFNKFYDFTPYLGIGVNHMNLEFHVNSSRFGIPDSISQSTSGNTYNFTGGFNLPVGKNLNFGLQLLYSPLYVRRAPGRHRENDSLVNFRTQITYHFGKGLLKRIR